MRSIPTVLVAGLALTLAAGCSTAPAAPAPLVDLVRQVDIPFDQFTLDNGLRVVVHEDRKAPVVAVSIWYNVGSKDEPAGRTGFAHLFEHLMFAGSENAPGSFFNYLRTIGATDANGTTWFDRTNYFQTVPTPALEQMLYLESDRMGHLLGAVSLERLDNQRGVVQNEKRQGDNQPYGLVNYAQLAALFPEGHPYRHSTIGSMADLDAATIDDVRQWFREKYGPNNAVLVLAGDIDAPTARRLVQAYFGHIPRGPQNVPAAADVPTPGAPVVQVMRDRVANVRLYRSWAVPGMLDADSVPLAVGAAVLGGLASSRLDNALVRGDGAAVFATASLTPLQRVGMFSIIVEVSPGFDPGEVGARLDEVLADLVEHGPTEDEVRRVATRQVGSRIAGLEQVGGFGGKAVALAEGTLYADDPSFYRSQLEAYATVSPGAVADAMQRWLRRPGFVLRVEPGARDPYDEAVADRTALADAPPQAYTPVDRAPMPGIGPVDDLRFPAIERATLANGVEIVYARSASVPVVRMAVEFDAGLGADPDGRTGLQRLMLGLLTEGTTTLDSTALAEAQERLGATIGTDLGIDRTAVTLLALTPNLGPSLDLLADVVRRPAFEPSDVDRLRARQLAAIASELTQPGPLGQRTLMPILYGEAHPYGRPPGGLGTREVVEALTRDDLVAFHHDWFVPGLARIFAVGDVPLRTLADALESRFGDWEGTDRPPAKRMDAGVPELSPHIVLVDRPQSPQSLILGGVVLPVTGRDDLLTLTTANEVLGTGFLSRLNTELREVRGWSYGLSGNIALREHRTPYVVQAPVQSDRTGDSIVAILEQMGRFLGEDGVTAEELERTIAGNTRRLAGSFETSASVLGALRGLALYNRPDDYWERVASRYHAMTAEDLDRAARAVLDPSRFVWVVVGDADLVRPQLEPLGLEVDTRAVAAF